MVLKHTVDGVYTFKRHSPMEYNCVVRADTKIPRLCVDFTYNRGMIQDVIFDSVELAQPTII